MDEFEDGFNTANDAAQAADKGAPAATEAPAPEPAKDDAAPAGNTMPEGEKPKEEQVQSPAPAPAPANDDDDPARLRQKLATVQGMLAKQGDELRQLRDAQKAAPAPAQAPAPAPAPADDDDAALLAELEESSPVLAKAIKAAMKRERSNLEQVLADKYGKSIEEVKEQLQPLKKSAEELSVEKHNSAITTAHPDAFTVVETQEFSTWVNSQSGVVKSAYQRVLEKGTASEVIEMLGDYKKTLQKADDTRTGKETDLAAARREQQMKSATGVPTRTTPVNPNGSSKNDFDAGFDAVVD